MLTGLPLLLALGTWQTSRYFSKVDTERALESRQSDAPRELADLVALDVPENHHRVVRLTGTLLEQPRFLIKHRVHKGRPGVWYMAPLEVSGSGGKIMVNLGWLPLDFDPSRLSTGGNTATSWEGLVHVPDRIVADAKAREAITSGALKPDPKDGLIRLESYDLRAMYDSAQGERPKAPLAITLSDSHSRPPYPIAGFDHVTHPYMTAEKHLGYAITWYSLAVALLAIYVSHGLGLLYAAARPRVSPVQGDQ